MMAKIVTKFW